MCKNENQTRKEVGNAYNLNSIQLGKCCYRLCWLLKFKLGGIVSMKKWFNYVTALIILGAFVVFVLPSFAASPNYATSVEGPWPGLYYDGYIQIQPSYNENGYHAARGYFVYRNGDEGEVWTYTEYGKSERDSTIYSASRRYWDTWDLNAPPVTFNYNFDWIPHE